MKVHIVVGTLWAQLLPQIFTFYRLSNGSLVIWQWAVWCPSLQRLQRFDCNNKLVCSMSLKLFYFFTNITLPLLRIFGEHSSVSPMLLFGRFLIGGGHKFSEFACSTRRFVLCLTLCHFVLVFFSPYSIAITSLGEERTNHNAFRTFVRFVLVCF